MRILIFILLFIPMSVIADTTLIKQIQVISQLVLAIWILI